MRWCYLQLPQHLESEQLLPQVVSTLYNDRQEPPGGQVSVRRALPDPPVGDARGVIVTNAITRAHRTRSVNLRTHPPDFLLPRLLQRHRRRVLRVPFEGGGGLGELL